MQDGLDIHLKPVPKLLGVIRKELCPEACLASFKLETDIELIEQKATTARDTYGMDYVVANLLSTRRTAATVYG